VTRTGRAPGNEGYALVGVVVFAAVAMLVLVTSYEKLRQATRLEEESTAAHVSSSGLEETLGTGIALLQTGTPPSSPFTCRFVSHQAGQVVHHRLTYLRLDTTACPSGAARSCWSVEAAPWEGQVVADAACPLAFVRTCAGGAP
jgi:hypothetical protein